MVSVRFELRMRPAPGFAMLSHESLTLLLSSPGAGGGGQPMPDGTPQEPGGWGRFQIEVDDLEATVAAAARESGDRCEPTRSVSGSTVLRVSPRSPALIVAR